MWLNKKISPFLVLLILHKFESNIATKWFFHILASFVFLSKFIEVNAVIDKLILFYLKIKICLQTYKTCVLLCDMQIPFTGWFFNVDTMPVQILVPLVLFGALQKWVNFCFALSLLQGNWHLCWRCVHKKSFIACKIAISNMKQAVFSSLWVAFHLMVTCFKWLTFTEDLLKNDCPPKVRLSNSAAQTVKLSETYL